MLSEIWKNIFDISWKNAGYNLNLPIANNKTADLYKYNLASHYRSKEDDINEALTALNDDNVRGTKTMNTAVNKSTRVDDNGAGEKQADKASKNDSKPSFEKGARKRGGSPILDRTAR